MHIKDVLLMTLVTIAFGGVVTAVAFGIYSFGTWLFTFGRTFGIVSVCAITVVLLTVAVEVRLSMNMMVLMVLVLVFNFLLSFSL